MDTIAISRQPVDGVVPNSGLHQFDAGDFPREDNGDEFAALASAWVGGQYHDVG